MELKKMALAVVVVIAAAAAAVAATAHSKQVLQAELHPYPPGALKLGQSAEVSGVEVRIDSGDVLDSVAPLGMRGYSVETLPPDRRFLRLSVYLHNKTDRPVLVRQVLGDLRQLQATTGEAQSKRVVWLRGVDALSPQKLAAGEEVAGKVALDVSSFALSLPFVLEVGAGKARWGVDVIDYAATESQALR